MKYYRAKKEMYDFIDNFTVVKNELLTAKERQQLVPALSDRVFDVIDTSKHNTFKMFGCRFVIDENLIYS